MPGMPFHLEKGHALMALEGLLNDASHRQALGSVFDGLRSGTPLGQVFEQAVKQGAPTLDGYGGNAGPAGLGAFVRGSWFGQAGGGASPYWLDYDGDVDGIVREALLFAMEVAWGVDRDQPLPAELPDRRVQLLWHCAQRWFDAWVMWDADDGPVTVLFATPPHTGGEIVDRIGGAVASGRATPVAATSAGQDADMVLVCQEANEPGGPWQVLDWTGLGAIQLPVLGRRTVGTGSVGAYSISADAGGVRPRTPWA